MISNVVARTIKKKVNYYKVLKASKRHQVFEKWSRARIVVAEKSSRQVEEWRGERKKIKELLIEGEN